MKKVTLFTLGILFSIFTNSQDYHKLINESFYWDVSYADQGYICLGFGSYGPKRYKFSGDTLINGKTYSKLYYSSFINLNTPPAPWCPPFAIDTTFSLNHNYFIREDTIEKQVWRYMENPYPEETLLFDFSKEQGDTLGFEGMPDVIIDTVYYIVTDDGQTRKKIEWEWDVYSPGGYYIEGLGGASGPFQIPYDEFNFFGAGLWLMCVKDHENNPIWSNYSECYDFITHVPNIETNYSIIILPNPATNTFSIMIPSDIKILKATLYTQTGQKIFSIKAQFDNIDISNLKPGLYFAEIKTSEGDVKRKIVVQ